MFPGLLFQAAWPRKASLMILTPEQKPEQMRAQLRISWGRKFQAEGQAKPKAEGKTAWHGGRAAMKPESLTQRERKGKAVSTVGNATQRFLLFR